MFNGEHLADESTEVVRMGSTAVGSSYQCYMYSATTFQKVMSFGQTPHSDAVCSPMGGAVAAPASCNALNKAAGKC